jgi:hypothetical protein
MPVEPGAVVTLLPQALGFADQSLEHGGIEDKAYRLVASRPVVANRPRGARATGSHIGRLVGRLSAAALCVCSGG